jgi:anti-sigma B factor antagonist
VVGLIGFMTAKNYQERNIDGITILTVERGLKGALETHLKDRIDDLVREGCLQIVVNLQQVPYVDSSDIGRIIRAHLSARQAGARVKLCNLSERVLAALKMTRLDTVLEIYESEEAATASLQQSKANA